MGRPTKKIDTRACPAGATRGLDVGRMYKEIAKIIRAGFAPGDVEVDDLIQETCTAILRKNASAASAFDPARASFSHYVILVARGKLSHMREKLHGDRLVFVDDDAVFDAVAVLREGDQEGNLEPATVASLVELLHEAADLAETRKADPYYDGFAAAARAAEKMLAGFNRQEQNAESEDARRARRKARLRARRAELAERIVALLSFAHRPVWTEELADAAGVTTKKVDRALRDLGERITTLEEPDMRTRLHALAA